MGYEPNVALEAAGSVVAPVVRRRRTVIDHNAQGQILLDSLLKSRGQRGATQEEALAVVTWSCGVHTDVAVLKAFTGKAHNALEHQIALRVRQAQRDVVLSGALSVDRNEAGALTFGAA